LILIADSGSTKTDWRILHTNGEIKQAKSIGFNPFHIGKEAIIKEINDNLSSQIKAIPTEIHFYGAGCSTITNQTMIKDALLAQWPAAIVKVEHDLLAAARALCLNEPGIACILGTGSNSCFYNGLEIEKNIPSLGYVLGDEGSGVAIGKKLLKEYLRGATPENITQKIDKRFNLSIEDVLNKTYKEPLPNRFLASFAKFVFQDIKEPYLYHLVYNSFADFFEQNVMRYPGYEKQKVHFTGSIAFYFANILRQVASDKNILVQNILESPIAGLTLYHQKIIAQ